MKILFKVIKFSLVIIPVLLIGQCIFMDVYQERGLNSLCDNAKQGMALEKFITQVANNNFKVRTDGPNGKDENEWFDRQYLLLPNNT